MTKNDVKVLWLTIGKVAVGTALMGVGFVTTIKGALNWGAAGLAVTMCEAAPEEYQKIADKIPKD